MNFFDNTTVQRPCTNYVHRRFGGIEGLREAYDDVVRLTVTASPIAMLKDVPLSRLGPACYMLADHVKVYIGETGKPERRFAEHAADPAKAFAREIYIISGCQHAWLDKTAAIYLQQRLTELAERAGLVDVIKGCNPQVLALPDHKRALLDHIVEHSDRLLFDVGCRVLRSNFASQRRVPLEVDAALAAEDTGPMQIGVLAAPLGRELELDYCGLWARGYPTQEGFVVLAGSEVRSLVNPSANPIVKTRRAELKDAQALMTIPGIEDRLRLQVAVCFPSPAIAAKVLTGAHVNSSKWVAPRHPEPILIAD
jgi:hypothetical protein